MMRSLFHHCGSKLVGFFLRMVIGAADLDLLIRPCEHAVLLYDVGQLMGQCVQISLLGRTKLFSERDVPPDGVGDSMNGLRRLPCAPIVVNAHVAEAVTEARLDESSRLGVEWPARRIQHAIHT